MTANNKSTETPSQAEAEEKPVDLGRYHDLEGVGMKKLEFGLWFIEHKPLFYKLIVIVLVLAGGFSWVYTLYNFAYYFTVGTGRDDQMMRQLVQTQGYDHAYVSRIVAHDLEARPVTLVDSGAARGMVRYDFAAEIINPNARHWGEFDYAFTVGGREIGAGHSFVLPDESKYLLALGEEFDERPLAASLSVKNLVWHRVDARLTADWPVYRDEHLSITVSDVKFTPPRLSGLSERMNVAQLDFSATNNSAYNYWRADFIILLWSRNQLVGVNRYNFDRFASGETRTVEMSWPGSVVRVDKTDIIPEIDIISKNNYFKFEAAPAPPPVAPR